MNFIKSIKYKFYKIFEILITLFKSVWYKFHKIFEIWISLNPLNMNFMKSLKLIEYVVIFSDPNGIAVVQMFQEANL